jgi:hypothetical protein
MFDAFSGPAIGNFAVASVNPTKLVQLLCRRMAPAAMKHEASHDGNRRRGGAPAGAPQCGPSLSSGTDVSAGGDVGQRRRCVLLAHGQTVSVRGGFGPSRYESPATRAIPGGGSYDDGPIEIWTGRMAASFQAADPGRRDQGTFMSGNRCGAATLPINGR